MKLDKDQINKDLDRDDAVDFAVLLVGLVIMATAIALPLAGAM